MTLLHRHGLKAYSDAGAGYGDDFVIVVETATDNETFTCPFLNVGTYNASVDWGDGAHSTVTAYNDADRVHTYADSGEHTIRISGTCPGWGFGATGDYLKAVAVLQFGDVGWLSFNGGFFNCSNLITVSSGSCNTAAVTSMYRMFSGCQNMTVCDVSGFNTGLVASMYHMFSYCSSLTSLDLSSFDTPLVTSVQNMFYGDSSLVTLDLSSFDTAAIRNMTTMFQNCSSVTSGSMDGFLSALYTSRMATTWATPAVNISPCQAPSGVYQDATPPTTGEEYRYKLENDPDAESFHTWTITV